MAAPDVGDLVRAKRIARDIQVVLKVVIMAGVTSEGERMMSVFVDSDWAGGAASPRRHALAEAFQLLGARGGPALGGLYRRSGGREDV